VETLWQDIRYGLRILGKSPRFAIATVLTLTLGIGANTAIFSVVYGVLLEPLPYHDPARLILLNETTPRVGMVSVSDPDFLDWRSQSTTFSQLAAVHEVGFNLSGIIQPESISGEAVAMGKEQTHAICVAVAAHADFGAILQHNIKGYAGCGKFEILGSGAHQAHTY